MLDFIVIEFILVYKAFSPRSTLYSEIPFTQVFETIMVYGSWN